MQPRAEFVYDICREAMTQAGLDPKQVWPVLQETDSDDKPVHDASIVYRLAGENWFGAINGDNNFSIYEINVRSTAYSDLDRVDEALRSALKSAGRGRLVTFEPGNDFVEDKTLRQKTYRRIRRIEIE